jgi:hypothetical protein
LLLFLVPIVLALAASNLLPQIPAHLRADPISYQERLSAVQVQFKNWTPLLKAIGAFYIEDTLWFRLLLASLTFVLFVSLGQEAHALLTRRPNGQPFAFYRRASRAVAYAGLLFLVAGLAANGRWGWQQAGVQMPLDEPMTIGPAGDHRLEFIGIEAEPVETLQLWVNGSRPLRVQWGSQRRQGRFLYQWVSKGGPLVQIYAKDADGERLTLYNYEPRPTPVETLRFAFSSENVQDSDPLFIVAATRSVGRLAWLNREATNGVRPRFYLSIFGEDGRTPLAETEFITVAELGGADEISDGLASPTATLAAQLDEITYVLEYTRYVVVDVAYRPGLRVLWSGGILLAAGILAGAILRWRSHKLSDRTTESEE